MPKTWNYQQLTAAAERELQAIADGAPADDPAIRLRRAGVAHGVYMPVSYTHLTLPTKA